MIVKKPLKPSLKAVLKAENERQGHWANKKQLNQTRGDRVKGGHFLKAGMAKAPQAMAKNLVLPITHPVPTGMKMHMTGGWDLRMSARS